jgi:hypothetical protein
MLPSRPLHGREHGASSRYHEWRYSHSHIHCHSIISPTDTLPTHPRMTVSHGERVKHRSFSSSLFFEYAKPGTSGEESLSSIFIHISTSRLHIPVRKIYEFT